MRNKTFAAIALAVLVLGSLSSASEARGRYRNSRNASNSVVVPAGTSLMVRLDSNLSTDEVRSGDAWSGTVTQSVTSANRVTIPAGSQVQGVVTSSVQGTHDVRPMLTLAVRQVTVDGQARTVNANAQPIVAGTSRAKKLGAVALGAGAGALLGHTVAKDNHGTLIGGIVGGAAGYGLSRHALRTLQIKSGTVMSFTTSENVLAMR